MDSGFIRTLAPQWKELVEVDGPFGGEPRVHLKFFDGNGVLWFRADRIHSVSEWMKLPERDKWEDPDRVWTRVWPEHALRNFGASSGDGDQGPAT